MPAGPGEKHHEFSDEHPFPLRVSAVRYAYPAKGLDARPPDTSAHLTVAGVEVAKEEATPPLVVGRTDAKSGV